MRIGQSGDASNKVVVVVSWMEAVLGNLPTEKGVRLLMIRNQVRVFIVDTEVFGVGRQIKVSYGLHQQHGSSSSSSS